MFWWLRIVEQPKEFAFKSHRCYDCNARLGLKICICIPWKIRIAARIALKSWMALGFENDTGDLDSEIPKALSNIIEYTGEKQGFISSSTIGSVTIAPLPWIHSSRPQRITIQTQTTRVYYIISILGYSRPHIPLSPKSISRIHINSQLNKKWFTFTQLVSSISFFSQPLQPQHGHNSKHLFLSTGNSLILEVPPE